MPIDQAMWHCDVCRHYHIPQKCKFELESGKICNCETIVLSKPNQKCTYCNFDLKPTDALHVDQSGGKQDCYHAKCWETLELAGNPATILDKARQLTSADRSKVYGHPRDHFAASAAMLTAYLHRRGLLAAGKVIVAQDWAMIMTLDKVVRNAGNLTARSELHLDSLIDIAGYARTGEMLGEKG